MISCLTGRGERFRRPGLLLALPLAAMALGGCDQLPLLAPTQSTITLVANRTTLPINGSTEIIATVTEQSGTPAHNGTLVTFTTTLGRIEPREAHTQNGQVTVTLHAGGQSGTAKVGAFSGPARATELEIRIGGAAAERIVLSVNPGSVPARGGTVEILAVVGDTAGNGLPGVPVRFTASAGTLSLSTVVTNDAGEARTQLTTDRETTVTATAGNQQQTLTVRVGAAPNITVSSSGTPTTNQPTTFTVNVTAGASPIRTVTINFGDGAAETLGTFTGSTSVSHIYRSAGTFTVTGTVTDAAGERTEASTVVAVSRSTPPTVTISVSANPTVGQTTAFTVTATAGSTATPIREVTIDFGDGTSESLGAASGSITVSHVYKTDGAFRVTATARDSTGTATPTTTVINVAKAPPIAVTITASNTNPARNTLVTFTANVSGSTTPIRNYEWNFGDGNSRNTTGNSTTHSYNDSGKVVVTVTVTAQDGTTGKGQIEIIVQ